MHVPHLGIYTHTYAEAYRTLQYASYTVFSTLPLLLLFGHQYGRLVHLIWAHASRSEPGRLQGLVAVSQELPLARLAAGSPRSLITVIRGDPGPRRL